MIRGVILHDGWDFVQPDNDRITAQHICNPMRSWISHLAGSPGPPFPPPQSLITLYCVAVTVGVGVQGEPVGVIVGSGDGEGFTRLTLMISSCPTKMAFGSSSLFSSTMDSTVLLNLLAMPASESPTCT